MLSIPLPLRRCWQLFLAMLDAFNRDVAALPRCGQVGGGAMNHIWFVLMDTARSLLTHSIPDPGFQPLPARITRASLIVMISSSA